MSSKIYASIYFVFIFLFLYSLLNKSDIFSNYTGSLCKYVFIIKFIVKFICEASNGWLYKFKQRHGIRQLSVKEEKLSCHFEDVQQFREKFQSFITNHGYTLHNIYNANETGLNWKALPASALAAKYESSVAGFKISTERITAMICANANGTHKLPILIIHKYKKPRCMQNIHIPQVVYKAQKNAWMDTTLFFDW